MWFSGRFCKISSDQNNDGRSLCNRILNLSGVLTAIGETPCGDGLELLDQLHAVSGVPVPCRLAELKGKSRRFDKTVEKQAMEQAVLDFLK